MSSLDVADLEALVAPLWGAGATGLAKELSRALSASGEEGGWLALVGLLRGQLDEQVRRLETRLATELGRAGTSERAEANAAVLTERLEALTRARAATAQLPTSPSALQAFTVALDAAVRPLHLDEGEDEEQARPAVVFRAPGARISG